MWSCFTCFITKERKKHFSTCYHVFLDRVKKNTLLESRLQTLRSTAAWVTENKISFGRISGNKLIIIIGLRQRQSSKTAEKSQKNSIPYSPQFMWVRKNITNNKKIHLNMKHYCYVLSLHSQVPMAREQYTCTCVIVYAQDWHLNVLQ